MKTRWIAPMVGLAVLALAGHARAQVKYVDERGEWHIVQDWDAVPDKYRNQAMGGNRPVPKTSGSMMRSLDRQIERDQRAGDRLAWESAVKSCLSSVRERDRSFDAYVSGPGRVQMIGTAQARFAFTKCMTDAGMSLQ